MTYYRHLKTIKGIKIWHEQVDCHKLTIVIPGYDSRIADTVVSSVSDFLTSEKDEIVLIVYNDDRIGELFYNTSFNTILRKLNDDDMDCLSRYIIVSAKHYGVTCNPNVKYVSFEGLYGRQLDLIANNNLQSSKYLIDEMVFHRR